MTIECIVLDFDGTFTRVDEEAVPFVEGFREGLAAEIGPALAARWDATAARVLADPDRHGWSHEGHIVAPAHADPYILANTVGHALLVEAGMASEGRRAAFLNGLYQQHYAKAGVVFRDDARAVVEALIATGLPVFVVTNARTEHVERKLDALGPVGREHLVVRGDARKFVLAEPERALVEPWDARWAAVPAERSVAGLARPVYLRRGHYFDALRRVLEETGAQPEATVVCGDIWELDLALPAQLGMRTHLVARPGTPEHEKRAVRSTPLGSVSPTLSGLLAKLEING